MTTLTEAALSEMQAEILQVQVARGQNAVSNNRFVAWFVDLPTVKKVYLISAVGMVAAAAIVALAAYAILAPAGSHGALVAIAVLGTLSLLSSLIGVRQCVVSVIEPFLRL